MGARHLRWVAVDLTAPGSSSAAGATSRRSSSAALGRALAGAAMLLRLSRKTRSGCARDPGDGPLGKG